MPTRDYSKHYVSNTQPSDLKAGDEWFNPASNRLYKQVVLNGANSQPVEVITNANTDVTYANGNIGMGNTNPQHKLSVNGSMYLSNPFIENSSIVSNNYTVAANVNAMTIGPTTIADNVVVTVADGGTWTIV